MKNVLYIAALVSAVLASGCARSDGPAPAEEKVRVTLSGSLKPSGATRGEGMINPMNPVSGEGLPPRQLEIGIFTIETPLGDDPALNDWAEPSLEPYLDRGFFGGNRIGDTPTTIDPGPWNGNIEYTNRAGDALQQVFYDETGIYYQLVAFYPYDDIHDIDNVEEDDNESMILDETTWGAIIVYDVDGSQDIMSTGLGKGNIEIQNREVDPLVFKHRLAALRCLFEAESQTAADLHGSITKVELIGQPDRLGLSIGLSAAGQDPIIDLEAENFGVDVSPIGYPAVRSTTDPLPLSYPAAASEFGYMLVKPAQKYTFRIETSVRGPLNPLEATYDFNTGTTPLPAPAPGTAYKLTFTMLESASIELKAVEATNWWLDQTYD